MASPFIPPTTRTAPLTAAECLEHGQSWSLHHASTPDDVYYAITFDRQAAFRLYQPLRAADLNNLHPQLSTVLAHALQRKTQQLSGKRLRQIVSFLQGEALSILRANDYPSDNQENYAVAALVSIREDIRPYSQVVNIEANVYHLASTPCGISYPGKTERRCLGKHPRFMDQHYPGWKQRQRVGQSLGLRMAELAHYILQTDCPPQQVAGKQTQDAGVLPVDDLT